LWPSHAQPDLERPAVVRDGNPVQKSTLIPNADAPKVSQYLKARAVGVERTALTRDLNLSWSQSTLVCMEWNALTYAGHTDWNVHAERGSGTKRRPREEWVVKRDTHEPLITDIEAEALLVALSTSTIGAATSKAKTAISNYLLTGAIGHV